MTWWTPIGERIIEGAEAEAIRYGIDALTDTLLTDDEFTSDIQAFDELTRNQKLAMLLEVATHLLTETKHPELTAVLEATVAAVFAHICDCIAFEIDENLPTESQAIVRDALKDHGLTAPRSRDHNGWSGAVADLSDLILWDADYESAHLFLDADTGGDYFTSIAPDPRDCEIDTVIQRIRELTERSVNA